MFLVSSLPAMAAPVDLLIKAATVIDGTGAAPVGPVDIAVRGSHIVAVGKNLALTAKEKIDATGKTVIPGLIDCHTHLPSVPGAIFRGESGSDLKRQQLRQLKAYLAAGVTTVLDAASPPSLFTAINEIRHAAAIPRVFFLAPFLTPEDGYFSSAEDRREAFSDLWPPVRNLAEIEPLFAKAAPMHPLGTKVTEEYGFGPFKIWPVFSDEMLREIAAKARAYHSPIFVHSEREQEFRNALKLKPYAFMHAGFFDEDPSQEVIKEIKDSGAYVVSTLAIFKLMNLMWNRELFNDSWFQMLVPEEQRKTALDDELTKKVIQSLAARNKPSISPEFIAKAFAGYFVNRVENEKQLASSGRAVALMHKAGIPIVMGADEGNWPVLTTMFHGVGAILEVEALQEAGLSPVEVINAASGKAAQMLKIDQVVGTITVGRIADLVILDVDPLKDRLAFRKAAYVVKDGVAKRPMEWLQ